MWEIFEIAVEQITDSHRMPHMTSGKKRVECSRLPLLVVFIDHYKE